MIIAITYTINGWFLVVGTAAAITVFVFALGAWKRGRYRGKDNQVHAAELGAGLPTRTLRRRASSRAISYSRASNTPSASASTRSS